MCWKYPYKPERQKRTFWHVRPTKTQISQRIRAVWSESSLSTWRNFAFLAIQSAPSEDSDQTAHAQSDLNLRWAHMFVGPFLTLLLTRHVKYFH